MLYQHQQKIISEAPRKHLLAWTTGTGKTVAAIKLSELYKLNNVLVICPKTIKEQWQGEIAKFAKEKRLFTVMTKEEFKKQAQKLPAFKKIIVDEVHYFFGYKSQLHKTLLKYLRKHKPRQVYLATATPYLSSVWNIYSAGLLMGYNWKWHKWRNYFFDEIPMGKRVVPIQKEHIQGIPIKDVVAQIIRDRLGSTVKLEDCADVPEQIFLVEKFDLTQEQEQAMKDLNDTNHIVYWTKCHQINGGTLKSDGYTEDQYFKCAKLARVKELCLEHKKLVIVCRYNNELRYLQSQIKNKKTYIINGETKDKVAQMIYAESDKDCAVLVNAACSEGYELPSFPVMVFYSYDFSLKNYMQMIGRIQRINALKKNVYISLVNRGGIDEGVYKTIQKKQDFDIAIYNKKA